MIERTTKGEEDRATHYDVYSPFSFSCARLGTFMPEQKKLNPDTGEERLVDDIKRGRKSGERLWPGQKAVVSQFSRRD